MLRFLWFPVWLITFLILLGIIHFTFDFERIVDPGPTGVRDQGGVGMVRGMLTAGLAFVISRFLANRIVPTDGQPIGYVEELKFEGHRDAES